MGLVAGATIQYFSTAMYCTVPYSTSGGSGGVGKMFGFTALEG